ncbi:MAG: TRAP-type C4-dicarboxylate transport system permease small subunit [Rhodothermales bacterium]|jgi:TRAP-type C4-dicarboxylate transport system permease small subunit
MKARVDTWLGRFVVLLMTALVLDVVWQVLSRFVLRDPSTVTEELARYLLIWLGLFGAAYAAGQGSHLSVDLLGSTRSRRRAARVAEAVFGLLLVGGGARLVYLQLVLGQTSAALGLPMGVVYLAAPFAGMLFVFYAFAQGGADLASIKEED